MPQLRLEKMIEVNVGIDFGCSQFKVALSFTNENDQTRLQQSSVKEDDDRPERANTSIENFEYPALASIYDDRLVTGSQCEELDDAYVLKTIGMHSCGIISKTALRELPDGAEVLDAFENRRLFTAEMELSALKGHLVYIRDQVCQQVEAIMNGVGTPRIMNVFVSVPNYMQDSEKKDNFSQLEVDYLGILCPIWASARAKSIRVFTEGQAVVSYLTAASDDPLRAWRKKEMWRCFRDLRDDGCGRYFVVVDSGSSSVNIEVLRAYTDETGALIRSQSHCEPEWQKGVRGGIGITNNAIRPWIREQLGDSAPEGELAHLMKQWEALKGGLDYTEPDASVTLCGKWSDTVLIVSPRKIHQVYKKAFKPVYAAVREVVERMLKKDNDFGIILCGGSFCNAGYRKTMQDYIAGAQAKASQDDRVRVRYTFLADHDPNWSTAVASGLAVIEADTPSFAEVFQDSSIGLQLGQARSRTWCGRPEANILFSMKHDRIVDFVTNIQPHGSANHRFELVCHPAYGGGANDATFEMGPEPGVHLGPPVAYKMAFQVPCKNLPRYIPIRWRLQGMHLDSLKWGDGNSPPILAGRQRLGMVLSCSAISAMGRYMPKSFHKTWQLGVAVDPATKRLYVDFSFEFPASCAPCRRAVGSRGWHCRICRDVQVCERCYGGGGTECAGQGHMLVMFEQEWFLTV